MSGLKTYNTALLLTKSGAVGASLVRPELLSSKWTAVPRLFAAELQRYVATLPMPQTSSLLVGLLVFALASGCATSRLPAEAPQTLEAVNHQLEGRWARVELKDGRTIERVEDVEVARDSTFFYERRGRSPVALPTDSVAQVSLREKTGSGTGLIVGAAPGLLAAGLGVVVGTSESGEGAAAQAAAITGVVLLSGGLLAAVVGGLAGALIGDAVTPDEWRAIYKAPLERYRNDGAP